MKKEKILVTNVTGFQGAAIVKALVKNNYVVTGLSRSTPEIAPQGIEMAIGSFEDAASLENAFNKVDKVVLTFPLIFDEAKLLHYAQNVVSAWRKSNVSQILFNTSGPVYREKVGYSALDSKLAIENYFDKEKLPYISLRPTIYMDNLSAPFLLPVIQGNGIIPYPVPADKKIAWLSHQDLANFVVEALKREDLNGQKFDIGGIQLITGEEIAKVVSRHAGKEIHFVPVSPDDFEAQISGGFGVATAKEIANIYRFVKDNVEHLQAKNLREETLIKLPVALQTFDEWASEIQWS